MPKSHYWLWKCDYSYKERQTEKENVSVWNIFFNHLDAFHWNSSSRQKFSIISAADHHFRPIVHSSFSLNLLSYCFLPFRCLHWFSFWLFRFVQHIPFSSATNTASYFCPFFLLLCNFLRFPSWCFGFHYDLPMRVPHVTYPFCL